MKDNMIPCYLVQSRISKRWYFTAKLWVQSVCYDSSGKAIDSVGSATNNSQTQLDPDAITTRMLPEEFKGATESTVLNKGKYYKRGFIDTTNGDVYPRDYKFKS